MVRDPTPPARNRRSTRSCKLTKKGPGDVMKREMPHDIVMEGATRKEVAGERKKREFEGTERDGEDRGMVG